MFKPSCNRGVLTDPDVPAPLSATDSDLIVLLATILTPGLQVADKLILVLW